MEKIITVWDKWDNRTNTYEFNHISDGYIESELAPVPKYNSQIKAWKNAKWIKTKAKLIDGVVVYMEEK